MSKQNKMIKPVGDKTHFLLLNGKPVSQTLGSGILGTLFGVVRSIFGFGVEGEGIYGSGSGKVPKEKRGGWLNFLLPILGSVASSVIGNLINKKVNGSGLYTGSGSKKLKVEIMNKSGQRVNISKILKHADPTLTKALMKSGSGSGLFSKSGSGLKPLTQSQVQKLTGMGMRPKTKYMCNSSSDDESCGSGMYPSKGYGTSKKKNLKGALIFE